MNIEISIDSRKPSEKSSGDAGMNILLVGNFSAVGAGAGQAGPIRNMFNMQDFDTDAAIAALRPALGVAAAGGGEAAPALSFSALDDFHPDRLYARHPAFADISQLKQSLADPAKRAAAITLGRALLGDGALVAAKNTTAAAATSLPETAAETSGDLLTRLLGEPVGEPGSDKGVRASVKRMLAEAASEDLVADADPEAMRLAAGLEQLCVEAMRDLLHGADFRELEANWRAVQWLVEQVEFAADASLWLVDVGPAAVAAWAPALRQRVLQAAGGADLIVVLAEFSTTPASLDGLGALADAATELGARTFAAADCSLAGLSGEFGAQPAVDKSDFGTVESADWQALRSTPAVRQVGLGFPRMLLRQPYGKRSDPVDTFAFEELLPRPAHDAFCWGNPAVALAAMSLNGELRVGDLPLVTFDDGGGQAIKPLTEVYLTDSAGEQCLQRGIMPMLGQRGYTELRLPRFQSIAEPPTPL